MSALLQGVRLGAAVFALGLSLAGPQALGVALADSPGADSSSVSSASGQHGSTQRGSAAHSTRRVAAADSGTVPRPGPATRSTRGTAAAGFSAVPAGAVAVAEVDTTAVGPASIPASVTSSATPLAVRSTDSALPDTPQSPHNAAAPSTRALSSGHRAAASAAVLAPVTVPSETASHAVTALPMDPTPVAPAATIPVSSTSSALSAAAVERPASLVATPRQVIDTVVAKVATLIDQVHNWLSTLPGNPVTAFLDGALALIRRALDTPGPVGFTPGTTQITIRNETAQPFDIYAHYDGHASKQLVYVATVQPIGEWSNEATNEGDAYTYDHNLVIYTDGVPRMRLAANNTWIYKPHATAMWTNDKSGQEYVDPYSLGKGMYYNSYSKRELAVGETNAVEVPSGGDTPGGIKLWFYRGPDIEGGPWFRGNTKNIIIAVQTIPTNQYLPAFDPDNLHANLPLR